MDAVVFVALVELATFRYVDTEFRAVDFDFMKLITPYFNSPLAHSTKICSLKDSRNTYSLNWLVGLLLPLLGLSFRLSGAFCLVISFGVSPFCVCSFGLHDLELIFIFDVSFSMIQEIVEISWFFDSDGLNKHVPLWSLCSNR